MMANRHSPVIRPIPSNSVMLNYLVTLSLGRREFAQSLDVHGMSPVSWLLLLSMETKKTLVKAEAYQ